MNLSPKKIRQIVQISFSLEPLLDKQDCTTRYRDLPGKSLTDFIIAGINVGSVFEEYVHEVINNKSNLMFSHFSNAVESSNDFKSKKFVNVGLLEFMFVTINNRLRNTTLEEALVGFIETVKNTSKKDVLDNLQGFRTAIKTSKSEEKKKAAQENYEVFNKANNIYELYQLVATKFKDPNDAGFQVAYEYLNGFPIVQKYITEIDENKGIIKSIEDTYNRMHEENPIIKVGILADLAAAALFLYLSYQNPEEYIIQ